MLCWNGDEGWLSSCRGENGGYSHRFVALEYPWNNLSGCGHISMRERGRQTRVSPALAGYRAGIYDVLEEAEGGFMCLA